jgi:hypothetical protein
MLSNFRLSFEKYQAYGRFFLLSLLIPVHFEPSLSLALDRALLAFEGAA